MKKIILLYSGGADSTLLVYLAKNLGMEVHSLIFDYGQIMPEVQAAKYFCQKESIPYHIIDLNIPVQSNITEDKKTYDGVSPYYMPGRNAIFVTIAASVAESMGFDTIWLGANYEDRENLFPDCYQEWVYSINGLLKKNGSYPITLECPLLGMDKNLIIEISEKVFNINQNLIFSGYGQK